MRLPSYMIAIAALALAVAGAGLGVAVASAAVVAPRGGDCLPTDLPPPTPLKLRTHIA